MEKTKTFEMEALKALPIFRNYDESQIVKSDPSALRPGSVPVFNILKWGVVLGLIFAFCKYALPIIFTAIGYTFAIAAVCVITFIFIMFVPTLFRWVKNLVRAFEKKRIDTYAFDELDRKKQEFIQNRQQFAKGKADCEGITVDLQNEAKRSENEAKQYEEDILRLDGKADKLKTEIAAELEKRGVAYKQEDDYIKKTVAYRKCLTDAERIKASRDQAKRFVVKFGARAAMLKKVCHKFEFVQLALDNKVLDLEATIDLLKKEFNMGKKLKSATDSANSVLGFSEDWQFEYALESISSTISNDISATVANLSNIEALTKGFNLDDDDMYADLSSLADNIRTGKDTAPSADVYKNPDYNFTSDDKLQSGGFGKLM